MNNEYVIINKTELLKRIEELEEFEQELIKSGHKSAVTRGKIDELISLLYQSTPLIPEIEKAFDAGRTVKNYKGERKEVYSDDMTSAKYEESKDYIADIWTDHY
jgi:hypothetical protein